MEKGQGPVLPSADGCSQAKSRSPAAPIPRNLRPSWDRGRAILAVRGNQLDAQGPARLIQRIAVIVPNEFARLARRPDQEADEGPSLAVDRATGRPARSAIAMTLHPFPRLVCRPRPPLFGRAETPSTKQSSLIWPPAPPAASSRSMTPARCHCCDGRSGRADSGAGARPIGHRCAESRGCRLTRRGIAPGTPPAIGPLGQLREQRFDEGPLRVGEVLRHGPLLCL